jgi:cytochrome bd-type quinol oxidase subunit 2
MPGCKFFEPSPSFFSRDANVYSESYPNLVFQPILSFTLGWHHSTFASSYSKNRKSKVLVLVTIPVLYFLSYEISLYHQIYPADPITTALSSSLTLSILLYTYAITICGVLFGFGFRSVSRAVNQNITVRDYGYYRLGLCPLS